jgi:hypothetical protein
MRGRPAILLLAACLAVAAGCREEKTPALTAADNAILHAKGDERIADLVRRSLPGRFAGIVVFRSDVFLSYSDMLDRSGIPVLNAFGKASILLLSGSDVIPLLRADAVTRMRYLSLQGRLARLHPAFEIDMLRRFEEGKEDDPVHLLVRFGGQPGEADSKGMESAGYSVHSRTGAVWTISGPLRSLPALLENDKIIYIEAASRVRPLKEP